MARYRSASKYRYKKNYSSKPRSSYKSIYNKYTKKTKKGTGKYHSRGKYYTFSGSPGKKYYNKNGWVKSKRS